MKLTDFCDYMEGLHLPEIGESVHPDENTIREIRARVTTAVTDDEFLADCLRYELDLIESGKPRQGLTPFFILPRQGIRFSFGYWAPGATPGPHEHTAWTITGVCRNQLDVFTYDRDASYRKKELVAKNRFRADAGKVGFIYSPCIHAPINNSSDWSISFHLTSPRDGECPPDYNEKIPELDLSLRFAQLPTRHPYFSVMMARQKQLYILQAVRALSTMKSESVTEILYEYYEKASLSNQRRFREKIPQLADCKSISSPALARVDRDLNIDISSKRGTTALIAESPSGNREELSVNRLGREALAFAAKQPVFDVSELPGNLSADEKIALGEALEGTGLFRRV